jgi:hypothetical protein
MAFIEKKVQIIACDICGKESLPMVQIISNPKGFSNVLIGEFMNVCDDCKNLLIKGVDSLKTQRKAG